MSVKLTHKTHSEGEITQLEEKNGIRTKANRRSSLPLHLSEEESIDVADIQAHMSRHGRSEHGHAVASHPEVVAMALESSTSHAPNYGPGGVYDIEGVDMFDSSHETPAVQKGGDDDIFLSAAAVLGEKSASGTSTTGKAAGGDSSFQEIKKELMFRQPSALFRTTSALQQVGIAMVDCALPFDKLEDLDYLDEGAMCRVYSARYGGERVAVKIPIEGGHDTAENDLVVEMLLLRQISHPNIIRLLAAGVTNHGLRYIAVELLACGTLGQRLAAGRKLEVAAATTIARQLADALTYLHTAAVPGYICLHRDLKPDNVGFAADGSVKLFDFGLAKLIKRRLPPTPSAASLAAAAASNGGSSATTTAKYEMTARTGSPRYMSPEVAEGRPYNERADVYSFVLILWEMLANRKPFAQYNRERWFTRVVVESERPPVDRHWPPLLRELLIAGWDADMDARPAMESALQTLAAVEAALPRPRVSPFRKPSGGGAMAL
ncbi:unnamed protein product, partial [Phaeothamnion confervicola]